MQITKSVDGLDFDINNFMFFPATGVHYSSHFFFNYHSSMITTLASMAFSKCSIQRSSKASNSSRVLKVATTFLACLW